MNKKILIVSSNYYKEISNSLIEGSTNILKENNIDFDLITSPGCFEIPFLIKKNISKYIGFIALGCIIKGETYHFEVIADATSKKIIDLSTSYEVPIGFGILTCYNIEQAIIRSDINQKNKGKEAALALNSILYK